MWENTCMILVFHLRSTRISNEMCSIYGMSTIPISHHCQIITVLKGRTAMIMCVKECVVKVQHGFNHQHIHSQRAHLPPTLLHKYTLCESLSR